jgi:hypothetical protein
VKRETIHISQRYTCIGVVALALLTSSCASDRPSVREREASKAFPRSEPPSILAERFHVKKEDGGSVHAAPIREATAVPEGSTTPKEALAQPVPVEKLGTAESSPATQGRVDPGPSPEKRVVGVTGLQVQERGPAGATILVVADGALTDYESFTLPSPPRLVIDIPRARHGIPQPVALPAGSPILKIRTTQYRETPVPVVRLVFDLKQALPYRLEITGNQMQVLVSEEASKEAPSVPAAEQIEPAKEEKSAEVPSPTGPPAEPQATLSTAEGKLQPEVPVASRPGEETASKEDRKPPEEIEPAAEKATAEPAETVAQPPPAIPPPDPGPSPEKRVVEVTGLQVQERGPAGATILVVADGALTDYESFTLPSPPRLVIDIPRARHGIPQPVALPAGSPILKIRTTQYRETPIPIVRLVFDLRQALPFGTDRTEKGLQVSIGEGAQETVPAVVAEAPKKEAAPKAQPPPPPRKAQPPLIARRPRPEHRRVPPK